MTEPQDKPTSWGSDVPSLLDRVGKQKPEGYYSLASGGRICYPNSKLMRCSVDFDSSDSTWRISWELETHVESFVFKPAMRYSDVREAIKELGMAIDDIECGVK